MTTLIVGAAIGIFAGGASCFAAGMGFAFVTRMAVSSIGGM